ncbi:MAG TPA: DegT/DnrJ/EryC1/StrS family aminotransferase, partial [Gemmatimonadales bacterium]|nr:DegT/DnrJ/EryC1/StrS family aminotransferase [Gemmatimonadales bacterium]
MVPAETGRLIRLAEPDIDDADLRAVAEVLRSGWLVQGPRVAEFERVTGTRVGSPHAVAVTNGTAALHLSLLALDVGPGDTVAVATYSWPATANVIALVGARPLFVDIDPATWAMDPDLLDRALARAVKVKAVLPVHPFGAMAPMPRLLAVAERHGAAVVEDAACAIGARLDGRAAGAWGRLGCFSFHPRKTVTTGEGGMVTTADPALARRLRILRNHGLDPDAPAPDFVAPGFNLRLTEFQAALGTTQLAKLDRLIARRREVAAWYGEALRGSGLVVQQAPGPEAHSWQAFVLLLPKEAAPRRAALIAGLRARGVEAQIGTHHQPLTRWFKASGEHRVGEFPVTDDVAARALSLPMHASVSAEDVTYVVAQL